MLTGNPRKELIMGNAEKLDWNTARRGFLRAGLASAGAAFAAAGSAAAQSGRPPSSTPAAGGENAPGRFAGKVVLITGATSGIGEATARAFAAQSAHVIFNGRREALGRRVEQSIRASRGDAVYHRSDVRDAAQTRSFVQTALDRHGRIDAVFLNAGIDRPPQPIAETDIDAFDDQIATNLRGVFLGMKYTLPHLVASRGALVTMASIGGRHAFPNIVAYGASKAAVIHMTRAAAQEYGREVRINAVAPGPIETAMLERVRQQWGVTSEQLASAYPAKRIGTVQEVAQAVLWLCSHEASYVSGQILGVDGGGLA
jgi:NAD(P)-dependent dehydrogenase (short-subunit alcohol dehydrogenase family)